MGLPPIAASINALSAPGCVEFTGRYRTARRPSASAVWRSRERIDAGDAFEGAARLSLSAQACHQSRRWLEERRFAAGRRGRDRRSGSSVRAGADRERLHAARVDARAAFPARAKRCVGVRQSAPVRRDNSGLDGSREPSGHGSAAAGVPVIWRRDSSRRIRDGTWARVMRTSIPGQGGSVGGMRPPTGTGSSWRQAVRSPARPEAGRTGRSGLMQSRTSCAREVRIRGLS